MQPAIKFCGLMRPEDAAEREQTRGHQDDLPISVVEGRSGDGAAGGEGVHAQ